MRVYHTLIHGRFVCLGAFAVYRQEYLLLVFAVYCLYRAVLRDLIVAKAISAKGALPIFKNVGPVRR